MLLRTTYTGGPGPWLLKAVRHDGLDVTDSGIAFKPGETVDGIDVVLTNVVQDVSGNVTNANGDAVKDYTVVFFAQDREQWRGVTRFFATGRPDQQGRYSIRTLPPGQYFAVALEAFDQNQRGNPSFFESASQRAVRVAIREGEARTLDLKLQAGL
jgi:hypothetical protein